MPSSGVQTCALRSEEHTSELQSHDNLVCPLLLEKNECQAGSGVTATPGSPSLPPRRLTRRGLPARWRRRLAAVAGPALNRPVGHLLFFIGRAPPPSPPFTPPPASPP